MYRLPAEVPPPPSPAVTLDEAVRIAELVCGPLRDGDTDSPHDLARSVVPNVHTKIQKGTFRRVLLVGGWAIKVDQDGIMGGRGVYVGSVGEALAIERLKQEHAELAHHFPATRIVNGFTAIQERCDTDTMRALSSEWRIKVRNLAVQLGIGDTHEENIGWRGDTPVFIDVQRPRLLGETFPELSQYGGGSPAPLTLNA